MLISVIVKHSLNTMVTKDPILRHIIRIIFSFNQNAIFKNRTFPKNNVPFFLASFFFFQMHVIILQHLSALSPKHCVLTVAAEQSVDD